MDDRLARLERAVAEAADAWLTDPRDTGVYARLVQAVLARRAYLNPPLDGSLPDGPRSPELAPDAEAVVATVADRARARAQREAEEELAERDAQRRPAARVGDELTGDPKAVLDRLRR